MNATELDAKIEARCCSAIYPCSWQRHHGMDSVCPTCTAAAPSAKPLVDALTALKKAKQFIVNGVELGFIRMPSTPDSAHETLPAIESAIEALSSKAGRTEAEGRDFWLNYDHQTGQWCVENEPPKVIRTGAEVIHTREVCSKGR